ADIIQTVAGRRRHVESVTSVVLLVCLLLSSAWQTCSAQQAAPPKLLHDVFQDHAVLQRGRVNRVRGSAGSGELITVSLRKPPASSAGSANADVAADTVAAVTARADAAGSWNAELPPQQAGGPFVLTVHGSSGGTQQLTDVLIGDVFLCSGQS